MKVAIRFSRIILCLLLVASLLCAINILLMLKYNNNNNEKTRLIRSDFKIDQDLSIHQLPTDKSGLYFIHTDFISSKDTINTEDLVLVSHCTSNHLYHLITLCEKWTGPISVAIFVPGYSLQSTFTKLYILYQCYTKVHQQVSSHLVYPGTGLPDIDRLTFYAQKAEEISSKILCKNSYSHIKNGEFFDQNYAAKNEYPNNLLRNVARRSTNAKFSLVIDIDMIPNRNLYKDFLTFSQKNNRPNGGTSFYDDKSVFVLPAFEIDIDSSESLPTDKQQLIEFENIGKVRPFYYDICWKCQKPTDYDKWKKLEYGGNEIKVGYEVKWIDPWEPFFITSKLSADYDERFKQYGFNRISQACELHVSGFKFLVLDHAFLLHKGFKKNNSFHKSKDEENQRNKILFRQFKTELKTKYPNSDKRCY